MTLLKAMARMEGFYTAKSRPQRNNNPLDLRWGPEAKAFGAIIGDHHVWSPSGFDGMAGFALFPDVVTGFKAGQRWLSVPAKFDEDGNLVGGYLGATLKQVIYRFAPPKDGNDTEHYLTMVCMWTGHTPDMVLTEEMLALPEEVA